MPATWWELPPEDAGIAVVAVHNVAVHRLVPARAGAALNLVTAAGAGTSRCTATLWSASTAMPVSSGGTSHPVPGIPSRQVGARAGARGRGR